MVEIEKIINDRLLLKSFTGLNKQDFDKELKRYLRLQTKPRRFKVLDTAAKQLFFILFSANVTVTMETQAILFGVKDRTVIRQWKKRLNIKNVFSKPYKSRIGSLGEFLAYSRDYQPNRLENKIKTIGDFFRKFPNLQFALKQKVSISVPFTLTTTPTEDEMRRLRLVAQTTDSKRLCSLMDFRADILDNPDLSVDQAIQLIFIVKYKELGSLDIKEMAYLWGTSIEYMSRVLKRTLKTLNLSEEQFKEILYD